VCAYRSLVFTAGVSPSVTAPITWGDVLQAVVKDRKQGQILLGRSVRQATPDMLCNATSAPVD
jgi:hypothetical protein